MEDPYANHETGHEQGQISVKDFLYSQENIYKLHGQWDQQVGKSLDGFVDLQGASNFISEMEIVCGGQDLSYVRKIFTKENFPTEEEQKFDFNRLLMILEDPLSQIPYHGMSEPGETKLLEPNPQMEPFNPDGDNLYKHHNRMRLDRFLKLHKEQVEIYFNEFNREAPGKIPLVLGSDLPLIMRISFYMDNITLHQTKEDEQEFFDNPVAQVAIMTHLKLFIEQFNLNSGYHVDNPQEFKIDFAQYILFLNYFVSHEPTLFLKQSQDLDFVEKDKALREDNSQTDLEKEIQQNIEKYEGMLDKAQNEQDRLVIQNMLSALYDQLNRIQKIQREQSPSKDQRLKQKKVLTKQEGRKKNLAEIFVFYCKQQYTQNVIYTFERLLHESHVLNLSNFLLFCKHFKITNYNVKLQKRSLPIFFKKNASNYKEMTFDEFQMALEKIALIMYEDRDNEMPTDMDKVEAFYKYIGVDNPNYFRKHMHLLNPPFNIQDKEGFRLLPKDKERPIEMKKIEPQLLQELDRRKKEREFLLKKYMLMTPQPPTKKVLGVAKSIPNLDALKKNAPEHYVYKSYANKNQKDQLKKMEVQNKVSWQQLENLDFNDLNKMKGGKFRPTDLIDDYEDQEDRMYLGQYSLQDDKYQKQQQMYQNMLSQEQYGNYRNNLRPTEKYLQKNNINYNGSNLHKHHSMEDSFELKNSYVNQAQAQQQYRNNYNNSGQYSVKNLNSNIGQNYMARANQVDQQQRVKEQAMLNSLVARQQPQKGGYSRNY